MRVLIFFLALLPVFCIGQTVEGKPELVDKIIGVVGDEIVLYSDLESSIIEATQGKGTIGEEERCALYENILYQKLLLHQSKIDSVAVTDGEVAQQVQQRLDYYIQMFGSTEKFESYYGKTISQLKEEFADLVKDQILVQKEQQSVTKNVKVTPADVLKFYNTVPKDSLPLISEQLQYSQIVFDPVIREAEKDRVIHFLDSIRNDLIAGRTSMTIQAAKYSEDPGSKYKGGCYPLQRKRSFVPEYEAAVFNTPEGSYTPVFKSDYGYHFVKVIERRGEFYESCHILIAPKVIGDDLIIAQAKADSVHKLLEADSIKFERAAVRFSTDKKTKNQQGKVMNDANGGSRHEIGTLSPEVNLQLQQLQPGEITPPILLNRTDGTQAYVIYKLDDRKNAHRATMDDDYDIFKAQADAKAKQVETDKWVTKRLKKTYVSISPEFNGCTYQFPWLKNKP